MRISTSEKVEKDGETTYINSNWFARAIGKAHNQAKNFKEITDITGIVLTKLDGSAKGGIVLAIKDEVKIPVKYIGLGEGYNDLKSFDIEAYIYGLFKDLGDKYDEK